MTHFAGGQDAAPLDGRCKGYSPDEAAALFDALGNDGRAFYAISELTLDVLFPLVYGAWLVICIWLVWGRPWRLVLAGVVVITCAADLVENALIAYMALIYNGTLQPMMLAANVATLLKWGLLAVAGLGLGLVLKYVVRK